MDVREKLIGLSDIKVLQREIECVKRKSATNCSDCLNCDLLMADDRILSAYANAIDALKNTNSVTVQEWIPVTERLPKLIPCRAGTAYSEAVNVLTSGRKVLTAIWDGTDFIADADFWDAEGEEITHWTPVLLPLPEPPKEETQ